jgi:hypothetical protein
MELRREKKKFIKYIIKKTEKKGEKDIPEHGGEEKK